MNKQQRQADVKKQESKTSQCKKLRHQVNDKIVVFTMLDQNLLKICIYDQKRLSEVYEENYSCDSLPNEAKKIFKSISEMFQFLQMNFGELVSLKSMDSVCIDLNRLKIPLRFQLPLRRRADPVIEDFIQTLLKRNQQTNNNFEMQLKHKQQITRTLSAKIQSLQRQFSGKIQFFKGENAKSIQIYQNLKAQNDLLKKQNSNHTQNEQQFKKNQLFLQQQLAHYKQRYEETLKQKQPQNSVTISQGNARKVAQKQVKLQIQADPIQENPQPQPKKVNPFMSGFFSKFLPSDNSKKTDNFKNGQIKKCLFSFQANPITPESRFHRFLQICYDGDLQLNLSNRFLKDSDIEELVQFKWQKIRRINLCENHITGKGLETLLTIKWNQLKTIALSSNKIMSFDLSKCNFKQKTPNLFLLDLNYNSFSKQMFELLVQFSRKEKSFKINFNGLSH